MITFGKVYNDEVVAYEHASQIPGEIILGEPQICVLGTGSDEVKYLDANNQITFGLGHLKPGIPIALVNNND